MNYERIILGLLDRIHVLEGKVAALEARLAAEQTDAEEQTPSLDIPERLMTSKYRGLAEHLVQSRGARLTMTYPEIEAVLGFALPPSAHAHMRAYWANTLSHSYAASWLCVGYRARVDLEQGTVTFVKNLQR